MNTFYYDLHTRHDSIIVKTYWDHTSYYLNTEKWKWVEIKEVDDKVFEDNEFYITYLDFGEWGGTIWFKDKITGAEYEARSGCPQINVINNEYFVTTGNRVFMIPNPYKLKECDPDNYYKNVEKEDKETQIYGSLSTEGTETLFQDTTFEWSSKFYIATSFISNKKLFHLCVDNNNVYVAAIENGNMKPIQNIGHDFSVYDFYYSYRCKSLYKNKILKISTKSDNIFGFVEIDGDTIKKHIFVNTYKEKILGTNSAISSFSTLFDYIFKNLGNVYLHQIDSLELNMGATDVSPHHMISLGTDIYPNKKNYDFATFRVYRIIEDSTFTFLPQYYYTKGDSSLKVIFLEWRETDNKRDAFTMTQAEKDNTTYLFKGKYKNIVNCISQKIGDPINKKVKSNTSEVTWKTPNGLSIHLSLLVQDNYRHITGCIYKD